MTKYTDKSHLGKKGFISAFISRFHSIRVGKSQSQTIESCSHSSHIQGKREKNTYMLVLIVVFVFLIYPRDQPRKWYCAPSGMGFSTSINQIKNIPHRHVPKITSEFPRENPISGDHILCQVYNPNAPSYLKEHQFWLLPENTHEDINVI